MSCYFYVNDLDADEEGQPDQFAIREGESYTRPEFVVTLEELCQLRAAIDLAIAERCIKGRS